MSAAFLNKKNKFSSLIFFLWLLVIKCGNVGEYSESEWLRTKFCEKNGELDHIWVEKAQKLCVINYIKVFKRSVFTAKVNACYINLGTKGWPGFKSIHHG